jgi:DNA-binding NarL/FixJ family response regulator
VTRVVVADDEELFRTGLRMIVEGDPGIEVVGEATDGEQAVAATRRHRPDVVLMDIQMPVLDGIEATRRITALGLPSRVLVLTTFGRDRYVFEALRAGASGFLLKTARPAELVTGIGVVARGEALLAPAITQRLIQQWTASARPDGRDPRLARLTDREREILRHIARGATNAELAATFHLAEATIKTHVGHILTKTGARDRVHAVVLAYESGLVRPGER